MSLTVGGQTALRDYPIFKHTLPVREMTRARYRVDFARDPAELDEVLRLRFQVFNLELGEGLDSSYLTGRDHDDYDPSCHHLRVIETSSGNVVGTYRLQTSAMAARHKGFYSSDEFDLSTLPESLIDESIEVGRACVARDHRNGQALFMLWTGLAAYMAKNGKRYLFGCCSLAGQDPQVGRRAMAWLEQNGHVHESVRVTPRPETRLLDEAGVDGIAPSIELPALFRTYLRYGGKVCGPPAIDRLFKTIDFFVVFDVERMDRRAYRMFFGGSNGR